MPGFRLQVGFTESGFGKILFVAYPTARLGVILTFAPTFV
jgi:hypothetical protein